MDTLIFGKETILLGGNMKVALSRKGFDSGYGGCPSPILPDGTILSLPIPSKKDLKMENPVKYANLVYDGKDLFQIISVRL